jgi:hypothetical protein
MKWGMEQSRYEEIPGVTKEASDSYGSRVELYEVESPPLITSYFLCLKL